MRIAFVGIEKDWEDLERRNYVQRFIKFHLELPWYYAKFGGNQVWIVTDCQRPWSEVFDRRSFVMTQTPERFRENRVEFDVVVHWRKWFEELHRPEAINVINSQDHSYDEGWLGTVEEATIEEKLRGILCFPTWHEEQLRRELSAIARSPQLLSGVTLGVDTSVYRPEKKDRRALLWASDPGRGIGGAVELAIKLFQRDNRFKLHVCWPDYARDYYGVSNLVHHPAFQFHRNLDNGPELWSLFNTCGFLPYTSTFKEPSSRAHRQAMAAGCVVLYPPDMGTPSELITSGIDGIMSPIDDWIDMIVDYSEDDETFNFMSGNARQHALSEDWRVQAKRFNELFEGMTRG